MGWSLPVVLTVVSPALSTTLRQGMIFCGKETMYLLRLGEHGPLIKKISFVFSKSVCEVWYKKKGARHWWLKPVILATWQAEMGRISQAQANTSGEPISTNS
jgi:hypothetical protein